MQKTEKRTRIAPGGMGNGLKRAYSKKNFISAITISKKLYDSSWFLYRMKPRYYKVPKLKITVEKGRPLGGFGWPKSQFRTIASPLSVMPNKKK